MSSLGRTLSTPGLSRGGSIGRSSTAHMGIGGVKRGGSNTRGSVRSASPTPGNPPPAPSPTGFTPGRFRDPLAQTGFSFFNPQGNVAFNIPGVEGGKLIANPFKTGQAKRSADVSPTVRPKKGFKWEFINGRWVQRPAGQSPTVPGAAQPAPQQRQPITDLDTLLAAFPNLQNLFLTEQRVLDRDLSRQINPLISQIAGLERDGFDSFGANLEQLKRSQREERRRAEFEAAASGLLNSGFRDIESNTLINQQLQAREDLSNLLGPNAVAALQQQIAQANLGRQDEEIGLLGGLRTQVSADRQSEFQQVLDQLTQQRQAQQQTFNEVFGLGA